MNKDILTGLRPAIVMTLLFALLLGIAYPFAMTGIGQTLFPVQANGSVVKVEGKAVGSAVVGQGFASDRYFNARPSAAGKGYDGMASSGSNYGPTSKALIDRVKTDRDRLMQANGNRPVPADLATASGSGLDPDISPAAAYYQVERVTGVRKIDPARVKALVESAVEQPTLGFLGDARVNLLDLNRRLDGLSANQR